MSFIKFHQLEADSDSEEEEGFYRPPEERISMDIRPNSFNPISVYDDKNRPMHQMAPIEGGSVLEILGAIIKQPTEGWKSLFKGKFYLMCICVLYAYTLHLGQRVTWVYEMLSAILRPALESTLNDLFGLYDDTIPLFQLDNVTPNITTMVFSHLVIGFLLSPLEIVRTRLVIQSSSPLCRKYHGTFHALKTMFLEEGGLKGVYLSKNLIPTLFYHTITPLISCSTPLVIARLLRISAADSPILYGVAELTLSTIGLLILLPIETIRKRLHCQVPDFKTAVATRPQPYRGFLDALYRILKEEGTRHKRSNAKKQRKQQQHWDDTSDSDADLFPVVKKTTPPVTSAWGIRGLYRGLSTQFAANVMLFIFQTMNGLEGKFYH